MNSIQSGPYKNIYNPENFFIGQQGIGAGNNWGAGYAAGEVVQEEVFDMIDREADGSDSLEVRHLVGKGHLRLLVLVVQNSDPLPIINQAYQLLKPGGYIQWDDLNYPDGAVVKANALRDVATPAHDAFLRFARSNGRNDWVLDLPRHLMSRHGGFEDAHIRNYTDRVELRKANGDQYILVMEEFSARLKRAGKMEDAHNIDLMIRGLAEESRRGVGLSMPKAVCVARKKVDRA